MIRYGATPFAWSNGNGQITGTRICSNASVSDCGR